MTIDIAAWTRHAATLLAHLEQPQREAQALLCAVLDVSNSYLYTWPDKPLSSEQVTALDAALSKRISGLPLAYIVGYKDFWQHRFSVKPGVLVPRPETELLLEHCLSLAEHSDTGRLLDLGTGTGAIALSFAAAKPTWDVVAVDASDAALAIATANANALGLTQVDIHASDWFSNVEGCFDVIVSNPPYIDVTEPELTGDGVKHEPVEALVAARQGMADIERIVAGARSFLKPHGWLAIEHGYQQRQAVQAQMRVQAFSGICTYQDYASQDRFTVCQNS